MLGLKKRKKDDDEEKSDLDAKLKPKRKVKEEKKASLAAVGVMAATVAIGAAFWIWGVVSETNVSVEREERVGGGVMEDGIIIFEKD